MGLNKNFRILVLSLAMASLAMGCGDGKHKKRQPVNKNLKAGQQKLDPNGKNKPTPVDSKTDPKAAEATTKQRKAEDEFDGRVSQIQNGRLMEKSALANGTYKLALVTTALKYMPPNGWLRAYRSQTLSLDKENIPQFSQEPSVSMGANANDADSGRAFEVPLSFVVSKDSSGVFRGERSSFREFVNVNSRATTTLEKGDLKVDLVNIPSGLQGDRATVKASFAELLATNYIEDKKTNDLKYSAMDGSKKIDLRIRQVGENKIRLVMEILEKADPVMIRIIGLDYDLTPDQATETPAPPAATKDGKQGAPEEDPRAAGAPAPEAVPGSIPAE